MVVLVPDKETVVDVRVFPALFAWTNLGVPAPTAPVFASIAVCPEINVTVTLVLESATVAKEPDGDICTVTTEADGEKCVVTTVDVSETGTGFPTALVMVEAVDERLTVPTVMLIQRFPASSTKTG